MPLAAQPLSGSDMVPVTTSPPATHETVRRRQAFWIVAATFGLFLFAAAAPSPLYAVYAVKFHFSTISLTAVFPVYAITLLVALLFTGSLSDSVGRRPMILGGVSIPLAGNPTFQITSSREQL